MAYENPTIDDFKTRFVRDFPFGTDPQTEVLDQDIANAYALTNNMINQGLFSSQEFYTQAYLLLSAHNLVLNLRASSQGLSGSWNWLEQGKSVGAVSQNFAIPQRILDHPLWSIYFTTPYGAQYMALILPQLAGQIFTVRGSTRP